MSLVASLDEHPVDARAGLWPWYGHALADTGAGIGRSGSNGT
jgi:hypothetical protein